MCGVINAARPVSFEIGHEAASKLRQPSTAFIHLGNRLFRFRSNTCWFPFLFVLVEAFTLGNIPQCTSVDPQQPH